MINNLKTAKQSIHSNAGPFDLGAMCTCTGQMSLRPVLVPQAFTGVALGTGAPQSRGGVKTQQTSERINEFQTTVSEKECQGGWNSHGGIREAVS